MIYPKFTLQIAKMIISGKCITLIYWVFKKSIRRKWSWWEVLARRSWTPNNSDGVPPPRLSLQSAAVHLCLFLWHYVGSQGQQSMSNINLRNGLLNNVLNIWNGCTGVQWECVPGSPLPNNRPVTWKRISLLRCFLLTHGSFPSRGPTPHRCPTYPPLRSPFRSACQNNN